METSTVTLVAPDTRSVPPELVTVPPVAAALARARNRTEPARPFLLPEMPSSAMVAPSGLDTEFFWGLSNEAAKLMEPALSAVRRITMTWSGALAKTSRWYTTPFTVYVTDETAVV